MIRTNSAVIGGGLATFALTLVLLEVPGAVPFEPVRDGLFDATGIWLWDDPIPTLRFLGGIGGGFLAGYLTRGRWYDALINASHAILVGLLAYYVVHVGYRLVTFPGLTPSIVIVFVLQPLLFLIVPYLLLYFFQSMFSSVFGNWVANVLESRIAAEPDGEMSVVDESIGIRAILAGLAFLVLFGLVWWLGFYIEAVY